MDCHLIDIYDGKIQIRLDSQLTEKGAVLIMKLNEKVKKTQ